MADIEAIKEAIEALPQEEYARLRRWFADRDWERWDVQIERDSAGGKLDFLVRDAHDERKRGGLKGL